MIAHLQQRIVQFQRVKDEASGHFVAVSSSASLSQHCSTNVSQSSLILPPPTIVARPSSATPSMPLTSVTSTLQSSTPIQSDIPVQSPVSNELQNQLPVITPPPPPPYPGPPPPYPSQLKVIIFTFHSNTNHYKFLVGKSYLYIFYVYNTYLNFFVFYLPLLYALSVQFAS